MTREEMVHLFARRERAMREHDAVTHSTFYADDAVLESPTAGRPVRGRKAIDEVTQAWFAGFPDVVFTTTELIIDGDQVVWVVNARGTDTGGFMGLPPTGKPFSLPIVMLCFFRDGKIVEERRVYDFTGLLVQVGILKAKPA